MKTRGCVHFVIGILFVTGCGPTPQEFHRLTLRKIAAAEAVPEVEQHLLDAGSRGGALQRLIR